MINATLLTIHGFWSSPATWERLKAVWNADEQLRGLRIHPFEYPSPKKPMLPFSVSRVPDYDDIAQTLATEYTVQLAEAPDIAIVTHSQGGLILQRFLTWMLHEGRGRELARIRTIVMLASPNSGSEYLRSVRHVLGYGRHPQAGNLEVLNRQVADTQRTVLQYIVNATSVDDHQCRIPFHVYAGSSDKVVTAASAQGAFPGASTLAGNHFSILDPAFLGNRTAGTVKHHLLVDFAAGIAWPSQQISALGGASGPATAPLAAEAKGATEKFRVDVRDSHGVIIGDHTIVTQTQGALEPEVGAPMGEHLGRPVAQLADPLALGVHRAIEAGTDLPVLTAYVEREHDARLREVIAQVAVGQSAIVVLIGDSSTGKTRACWEALQEPELRREWRLWHPVYPGYPQAVLEGLPRVAPRTVIWLDDIANYLLRVGGDLREPVAAGLRELLRDPGRAPVLVLGTIWTDDWNLLTATAPPGVREDPYGQARQLISDAGVRVPEAFAGRALEAVRSAIDPRLALAAEHAEDGRITQYLAGIPELIERYEKAEPAARAVIQAAMDARRLGHGPALSRVFLERAASDYLADPELPRIRNKNWLGEILEDIGQPRKGVLGPVTEITRSRFRTGPRRPGGTGSAAGERNPPGEERYQLADYLDQAGRRDRAEMLAPASFWEALLSSADSADLPNLAQSARSRGLLWYAALLFLRATPYDAGAACDLFHLIEDVDSARAVRAGEWVAEHAGLADVFGVCRLLSVLHGKEAHGAVTELADRAARSADLRDPERASRLLDTLFKCDAMDAAGTVADRAAQTADPADPYRTVMLLVSLHEAGAQDALNVLAARAAMETDVTNTDRAGRLLAAASWADGGAPARLATRVALETAVTSLASVAGLVDKMHQVGTHEALGDLVGRLADIDTSAASSYELGRLVRALREAGASEAAAALASRIAAHADPTDPASTASALSTLEDAQATEVFSDLAMRAADRASLRDARAIADLLSALHSAGASDAIARLVSRNPEDHVDIQDPGAVGHLLSALHRAGASHAVARLLAHHPAEHATVSDVGGVTHLSEALRDVGALDAADTLVTRAALHIDLTDIELVMNWLTWLPSEMRYDPAIADALLARNPGKYADLTDPARTAQLLVALAHHGDPSAVSTLLERNLVGHADLTDPAGTAQLLVALADHGDPSAVSTLLERNLVSHADLTRVAGVGNLLQALRRVGADNTVDELVRALDLASYARLAAPQEIIELLRTLRDVGATQAADMLLARYPVDRIDISDPAEVSRQLHELSEIGADDAVSALLRLDPADHVSLVAGNSRLGSFRSRRRTAYKLLQALSQAGAGDQADTLADRIANVGMFSISAGSHQRFRFGREPDGRPSTQWAWDDLIAHASPQLV